MRNPVMREQMDVALRGSRSLKTTKSLSEDEVKRRDRVRKSFTRTIHVIHQEEPPSPEAPPQQAIPEVAATPEPVPVPQEVVEAQVSVAPVPLGCEWLAKPNPFSNQLGSIVNPLLESRSRLAFTLEQATARRAVKLEARDRAQRELDDEEACIASIQGKLDKINATITGCELLAQQASEVEEFISPSRATHERAGWQRRTANDPTACKKADVLRIFESNRETNLTKKDIVEALPPQKRSHARTSVNMILASLNNQGVIRRVAEGIYRMPQE